MQRSTLLFTIALAVFAGRPAMAQTPAAQAPAAEADPGVRPTRLIDRAEIRVSRIDIQPGATRRVHTHDDVEYHLWIPIEGSLQITIGSDAPVAAAAGRAFFMKRGTPHGFKNVGTTPAAVFEIFVKQSTVAGGQAGNGALALALAAAWPERPRAALFDSIVETGVAP
jgi:quercetin dioxygenase-like cupin family protein